MSEDARKILEAIRALLDASIPNELKVDSLRVFIDSYLEHPESLRL